MTTVSNANFGPAADVINPDGTGDVVLVCEHASNAIPTPLNGLGLTDEVRGSHVAWDPGALGVARHLSQALNAPLIAGRVSRLVYDCNRAPESPSAMPAQTERGDIPGNMGLDAAARANRLAAVYRPFCAAVSRVLDARAARGARTALVTIHSFTPVFHGQPRDVEIGILHDSDSRLADAMLAAADALPGRDIRRNAPYGPGDEVTHSLGLHGVARGLPNVMIEIRSDLLADTHGEERMADEVKRLLDPALVVEPVWSREGAHA